MSQTVARKRLSSFSVTLTAQLIRQFCDLIKQGLPLDGCCDYLGVDSTQFNTWIVTGKNAIETELSGVPCPNELIFMQLVQETRKAFAEYRLETTKKMHTSRTKMWMRDLAVLERRDRKTWGKKQTAADVDQDYSRDERFL